MADISTISVDGETTDINKINLNGTEYNIGSKAIQLYKYHFRFTIPKKTSSSTNITLPSGAYPIGMSNTGSEGGNVRPPATRIEMNRASNNVVTISYSNPFEYSYGASGDIFYTLSPWSSI